MVAIAWKLAVSGSWNTTTNWNPAGTPNYNDVSFLVAGTNYVSTIDQSYFLNSLLVNSANADVVEAAGGSLSFFAGITVSAGFLRLNNANSVSAGITLNGGQIDAGNSGALGTSTLTFNGGTLRATSTETLANSINIASAFSATTIAAAHGATLTLTSANFNLTGANSRLYFGAPGQDGVVYFNPGAFGNANSNTIDIEVVAGTLTGNNYWLGFLGYNYRSITIDAGATLDFSGLSATGYSISNLSGGGTLKCSGIPTYINIYGGNFSGVISGNLSLSVGIVTPLALSGANTYFGVTRVYAGGGVTIYNASALSTGHVLLLNGALLIGGSTMSLANAIDMGGAGTTATIAANIGIAMTVNGAITFNGSSERLNLGGGLPGSISLGTGAIISGFAVSDSIDLGGVAYNAADHMVLLSDTGGVETFAFEDGGNAVLATLQFAGSFIPSNFSIANDGGGHALITAIQAPPARIVRADFNGDGCSDLALQSGGIVIDWQISGGTANGGYELTAASGGYTIVGIGDFNGNGTADLLAQSGDTLQDWQMTTGVLQGVYALGSAGGFSVAGTGDFNGDGTSDILLQSNGTVVDYIVRNGAVTAGYLVGSAAGWTVGGTGDFNGDGTTDILLQNNGAFTIWDMQNGLLTNGYAITPVPGWTVAGTGDFNGDGTTDILLQSGGTFVEYIMHNNVVAWGALLTSGLAGWSVVGTGDYNGDGTSDLMLQNGSTLVDYTIRNGAVASGALVGVTGGFQVVGH